MSLKRTVRFLVPAVVLIVVGFAAGAAAESGPWSEPGDPVTTLGDADRAIAWWSGESRAATRNPATAAEANDRIWLAIGRVVDDLMGLDLRTRVETASPAPTVFTMRSLVYQPEVGDGFTIVASPCHPGERVTGGGFDIADLDADGLPPDTSAVTPVTSYPIASDDGEGWAVRISLVPPDPIEWAPIRVYAICSR